MRRNTKRLLGGYFFTLFALPMLSELTKSSEKKAKIEKNKNSQLPDNSEHERKYSLADIKNALHSVELKDNKNYFKIWKGMEEWFDKLKQQEQ
jgi:hypothetical protein